MQTNKGYWLSGGDLGSIPEKHGDNKEYNF